MDFGEKFAKILVWGVTLREKNDVAQKIFIPQSCDGQIICSVDSNEQNGTSSFSMLPMVWGADPCKWNFSVSGAYFWNENFVNFGQTIELR